MGVEPTYQPWEGRILPMNYTRRKYTYYNRVCGEKQELFLEKNPGKFDLAGVENCGLTHRERSGSRAMGWAACYASSMPLMISTNIRVKASAAVSADWRVSPAVPISTRMEPGVAC